MTTYRKLTKYLTNFALLLLFFFPLGSAYTMKTAPLAIIDGKYVILTNDVQEQINFINLISKANLSYNKQSDKENILHNYIVSYLINKEAQARGYDLDDRDIPNVIASFEEANALGNGYIEKNMTKYHLNKQTLYKLIKQEYIATTFKQGMLNAMIQISQAEIDNEINKLLMKNGKLAFNLYEISIPISASNAKAEIDAAYEELQKGTAFEKVAQQYSYTLGKNGSRIGWVLQEILDYSALHALNNGGLFNPTPVLTTNDDYKIYMVNDIQPVLQVNINDPHQMDQLANLVKQKLMFEKTYALDEEYKQNLIKKSSIQFYDN